ncbi:hypothetical protein CSUI_000760 (apicoplast) [Cystoisospora suis]|uniref:Ribosomal protein S17 n=1 Tax=Cystoisospora suis TaxID=483139 RepID=A0A2C6LEX5_9APIC|nr:hypothetical protein CSUI_000760 [Cystoisospora suis]
MFKIGYIIKNQNNNCYKFIIPFWKKNLKYKQIQLKNKFYFFSDYRKEILKNFIVLIKFNIKQKKYQLIKILY